MVEVADYSTWLGRTEESRDVITAGPIERLSATLDHSGRSVAEAGALPPLGHWLYFLPAAPQSKLGYDGHPERGGFLPPVHELPRRMWAGSRISFEDDVHVGDRLVRKSIVASIERKDDRSGPLVFVTVRHEIGARAVRRPSLTSTTSFTGGSACRL